MTAVEWLFEKLWDEPKDKFTWYALREKAIQMDGCSKMDEDVIKSYRKTSEKY
jgi:hypothetical protein